MKFIDEVKITVKAGNGGPGSASFRREKYVPRGGPDGGDGGKGGNVIFRVTHHRNSLLDLSFKKFYNAENGQPGMQQLMSGRYGEDLILEVPVGTMIRDVDGHLIRDLDIEGDHVFLEGGRGGKGNAFFKSSVNQAPTHAQPGEQGPEQEIILELKLLADVGIIGYPNAGKSTLISHISAARPKVADYPFTTLVPNLGVVQYAPEKTFVVADIPGLIPGAHKGVGLGIQFLKHIERTRCFIHLIDASGMSGRDPVQDYDDINEELKMYDEANREREGFFSLQERPQIVVLNKMDSVAEEDLDELLAKFRTRKVKPIAISAATGRGLKDMLNEVAKLVYSRESK